MVITSTRAGILSLYGQIDECREFLAREFWKRIIWLGSPG
jgi:hypothetical protein